MRHVISNKTTVKELIDAMLHSSSRYRTFTVEETDIKIVVNIKRS